MSSTASDAPEAPDPSDTHAWASRASRLYDARRFPEAVAASDRALAIDPEHRSAMRIGISARLQCCDWSRRAQERRLVSEGLTAGRPIISPFVHRRLSDSDAEHLALARLEGRAYSPASAPLWQGERYRHPRIRLAYLAASFQDPQGVTIAEVLERHDRRQFETTAISLGTYSEHELSRRRRTEAAVDRFCDVHTLDERRIARTLRELEADIVIDISGYNGGRRTLRILSHRSAPSQVSYPGYPGTLGLPFVDYLIADRIVIPEEHRIHYAEKVVYLPHCYLPHDSSQPVEAETPSRNECGLPPAGFIFCCFNHSSRIGPEVFEVWMRLLRTVEGSTLWLLEDDGATSGALLREAVRQGIAPERLVFAPRVPLAKHLARQRCADLFLDTLPYNGHATARDALWVGLQVLTCAGNGFAARVGASLLHAIGLSELVTESLTRYEEVGRAIARDPARLAALKSKLLRGREASPLFDTGSITRSLEQAYRIIWERVQRGEPPESFAVATQ